MKKENAIWNFFASVKLALFSLCCIAVSSIVGTIIPQKESIQFYVNKYGPKTAQFFQLFTIDDMYSSWWFLGLLGLLSANLIICSIDRFPRVWKLIQKDNLAIPLDRVRKIGLSESFSLPYSLEKSSEMLTAKLGKKGWRIQKKSVEDTNLLFSQKSPYSRTGVYFVHLSILVIFAGAIYGQYTGFKASIMLPELQSSNVVYPFAKKAPIDLGFEVRCDRFDIEFYSNNMPKEYRSKLVVLENGKEVLSKDIEVNGPLKYRGITFYQSSYQGFRDFIFHIKPENSPSSLFTGEYQKEIIWKEQNIKFGLINLESIGDRVTRMKIWFHDDDSEPSVFWMDAGATVNIKRPSTSFQFSAKQRYATGLQVAKDPGVWIVYLGCALMLVGLYMAFFLSHKRIWLILKPVNSTTSVEFRGTANKNKAGFEKMFFELSAQLQAKKEI